MLHVNCTTWFPFIFAALSSYEMLAFTFESDVTAQPGLESVRAGDAMLDPVYALLLNNFNPEMRRLNVDESRHILII